jgi:hypothetical protein
VEDLFYYGILRAIDANEYLCERIDKTSFTGDVLNRIREKIETAAAVVADLTGANPNVYLEVGYAWGKGIPTILLIRAGEELGFDVRGQRCLQYRNIRNLEELLIKELVQLRTAGTI